MLVTAFIVTLSVLLTVAVPVVSLSSEAQQVARLPRIGLLYPTSPEDPRVPRLSQALLQGLRELRAP
jgi:hypothetical protein